MTWTTESRSTLVVEGIVIVASILLAFGIDAWWDERRAAQDEREHIAQLTFDFQANAARLANIRSIHEAALDASYEILARAGIGGVSQSSATTAELVLLSLRSWTYDPVLGGINSLIQSGNLGLLRNDSLRVAVAGWPDVARDLSDDERIEQRTLFDRAGPYLIDKGAMIDVLLAGGSLDRIEVAPESDLSDLLSDPVFLQMTSWRINNLENVMDEVQIVEDSIRNILELLEKGVDAG
jgi:hypothetical protein